MTRMKRKTLKVLLALALTLVLCLGTTMTVFAGAPVDGTEANPAEASINKVLNMPTGTTSPAATFTFEVIRVSRDDSVLLADVATMPHLGVNAVGDMSEITITFDGTETDYSGTPGIKTVARETGDILGVTWPAAGVYKYTIIERDNSVAPYTPAAGETFVWDNTTQYDLYVYVDNGLSGLYVKTIEASKGTIGTPATPGDPTAKVDPTPGTPGSPGTYSDMAFTNIYYKQGGGPNPATQSALDISKEVTGAMANQSFYFDYTLDVTQPAVITPATPAQVYRVYILDDTNANVITNAADATEHGITIAGSDPTYGNYFEVTSGSPANFKLKHNEHLAFTDLHVGTLYDVTEAGVADWTPSYIQTENNVAGAQVTGSVGTSLNIPGTPITEGSDIAAYSNAWKLVSPTGLDINDLPFIMMLVLAAGAIVTFVVVKYRRKRAHSRNS